MMKQLILLITMALSVSLGAHEGHDNAPGTLKANHGGLVKPGKEINLEYVVAGTEVKLYPITHEGKDLTPTEIKLSATVQLPKGKSEVIKIESKDGAYVAQVDFKNAYRIEMKVSAVHNGKTDNFKFQIEK